LYALNGINGGSKQEQKFMNINYSRKTALAAGTWQYVLVKMLVNEKQEVGNNVRDEVGKIMPTIYSSG
jgi:hypothetical protein